ncbi:MAG: hypothetical protein GX351_08000 [Peptococcaceae bacterium]|jgi:LSD1 subclass zinc finger protein|nr:hypothetical protein [Peptococcaceae bacterium]
MCFRPTSASKVINCPGCQKKLTLQQGHKATKCPFCGADLFKNEEENKDVADPEKE